MTPQPKYRQIVADIKEKIKTGAVKPGETIMSTAEMCDHYQVSATVVNQAVLVLGADGYIEGSPGVGRFAQPSEHWRKD